MRATATKSKNRGVRFARFEYKAAEGQDERIVTLSFSSEDPYNRWFGPEILDHTPGCCDLTRINEIGVLLFNHNRDVVCGKILRAWVDNNRGMAEVQFDTDEQADLVFQKVKSGTLKGVSVGYNVLNFESVQSGGVSADGRFKGPCEIAKQWEVYEISIVSVPADATVGVGRSDGDDASNAPDFSVFERQIQINKNRIQEVKKV